MSDEVMRDIKDLVEKSQAPHRAICNQACFMINRVIARLETR